MPVEPYHCRINKAFSLENELGAGKPTLRNTPYAK